MSDDNNPRSSKLPALAPNRAPVRSVVHLPVEDGFFGTRRARKRTDYVREFTALLDARAGQARSAAAYVDACHELARSMARLDWLPEVLEADYMRGKLQRAHEIEMDRIAHATTEAQARIGLWEAVRAAEGFNSALTLNNAQPSSAKGLTTTEVEMMAQRLPDMKPEMIDTLVMMLSGLLAEKNK